MALTANQLRKQVDLPTWEWMRFSPVTPVTGLSCSCVADNSGFNTTSGRYIYYLLAAASFYRYDTVTDTYEQLATPLNAPVTASTMRYAGAQGYFNKAISATTNTLTSGMPFGGSAVGFRIRIVSGKGAGQERIVTAVSDPIVADYGAATSGSATTLVDTAKTWTTGYVGSTLSLNNWVGYTVRILYGTGVNQSRRILYNNATTLTVGDINFVQNDSMANMTWTAVAAGSVYQIESSTITVDTPWNTIPDNTSKFVIQSGGIWLVSGAAATPFYTMQYYDILSDTWACKPALQNMALAAPTDNSIERVTENSTSWVVGNVSAGSSNVSIVDNTQVWAANTWVGYQAYIFSGNARGNIATITSNTTNTINFPAINPVNGTPDTTSQYEIIGYDGGTSTGANQYNTFVDSTKNWTANRWGNYGVRIKFGTGAGQIRQIQSNSTNTLQIYGRWNVTPDATSVYVIQGYSDTMYLAWGGSSEIFMHQTGAAGTLDMLTHSRVLDYGIACIAAALPCDTSHTIYEQAPIAITSLAGTTTITATTSQNHNLIAGQSVSIRGVTSAAADQYNVCGNVVVTSVPSTTSFTYTPFAAGTGAYSYLTAQSTLNLSDASKDYRDNVVSATNNTITFGRNTPSNINGWYVSGVNVQAVCQVISGAGTPTVTLNGGIAAPSGVITFSPFGPAVIPQFAFSSGGGAGVANVTFTGTTYSNIGGWYATGTGIAIGATVFSGNGTATINLSNACTGVVSGNVSFWPPTVAGKLVSMTTAAPVVTTGSTTGQLMLANASGTGGGTITFTAVLGAAPTAALTRYAICNQTLLGAALDQTTTNYNSGVATGGSITAIVDASAFWATATGTGTAQTNTITLSAAAPGNINGWYVSGTGVNPGAVVLSGAGTTTLTVSVAHSGTVSGVITCTAWNQSIVGRRVRLQSGQVFAATSEAVITATTPTAGTITFAAIPAPTAGVAVYSLLSIPLHGINHELNWAYGNSVAANRGRYIWMPRAGAAVGIDRLDLTTDRVILSYLVPFAETLGSGTMWTYDGQDRFYFTKDVTQRLYYLDLNTNWIHGAGLMPYTAGTAGLGNRMEIFTTSDGLKYLWINRQMQPEHFRQLLFY